MSTGQGMPRADGARAQAQRPEESRESLRTEQLRAQVLRDRVPVLSIPDERTWRNLVTQGRTQEAAQFQTTKAREFVQENGVIARMSHGELERYATAGTRAQQVEVVAQATTRLRSPEQSRQPMMQQDRASARPSPQLER